MTQTPEAHTDTIMAALEHEVNTYGIESLAGMCASLCAIRESVEGISPVDAQFWSKCQDIFEHATDSLVSLKREMSR